jgi:Spy/CpxP family protein refolding chaperone
MKLARAVTIVSLGLTLGATPAFAQNLNKREARQQHRIAEGIENGTLTPKETARLERQEARIKELQEKDRKSGGGLSPKEREELNRLLNLESHRIYAAKHDGKGK